MCVELCISSFWCRKKATVTRLLRNLQQWRRLGPQFGDRDMSPMRGNQQKEKGRSRRKENPGGRPAGASWKSSHVHRTQPEKGVGGLDTDPGEGRDSAQPADARVLCHPPRGSVLQVGASAGGDFLLGRGQFLLCYWFFLLVLSHLPQAGPLI